MAVKINVRYLKKIESIPYSEDGFSKVQQECKIQCVHSLGKSTQSKLHLSSPSVVVPAELNGVDGPAVLNQLPGIMRMRNEM
jgi:hypothetical protein